MKNLKSTKTYEFHGLKSLTILCPYNPNTSPPPLYSSAKTAHKWVLRRTLRVVSAQVKLQLSNQRFIFQKYIYLICFFILVLVVPEGGDGGTGWDGAGWEGGWGHQLIGHRGASRHKPAAIIGRRNEKSIEEGLIQKRRHRSSLLLGGDRIAWIPCRALFSTRPGANKLILQLVLVQNS